MGARAQFHEIFDEVWRKYRACLRNGNAIHATNCEQRGGKGEAIVRWGQPAAESLFVSDVDLAVMMALGRRGWEKRRLLFDVSFRRGVEYKRVARLVGVAQGTADWWHSEVKKACAGEFERRLLYPVFVYFSGLRNRPLRPELEGDRLGAEIIPVKGLAGIPSRE